MVVEIFTLNIKTDAKEFKLVVNIIWTGLKHLRTGSGES